MKYKVEIPPSKTKRFNSEPKIVSIIFESGWSGGHIREYELPPDINELSFLIPEGTDYIYNTDIIDGNTFNVEVKYQNKDKTRSETLQLKPILVE